MLIRSGTHSGSLTPSSSNIAALLPTTTLCKEGHGTISSERHINYNNNNYLQDFGGIGPGKSASVMDSGCYCRCQMSGRNGVFAYCSMSQRRPGLQVEPESTSATSRMQSNCAGLVVSGRLPRMDGIQVHLLGTRVWLSSHLRPGLLRSMFPLGVIQLIIRSHQVLAQRWRPGPERGQS